jgi:flavin reductase (DIM6/NTAB) family NADH-FMN oxidoreductase RutF
MASVGTPEPQTIHPRLFRDCAAEFATGVAVITCVGPAGEPLGVTINSFSTVSLDPPLVLFSLARTLTAIDAFTQARGWAINILSAAQQDHSRIFSQRDSDRFADIAFTMSPHGNPVIADILSVFECVPFGIHDGGDHLIFLGRVVHASRRSEGRPLLYFRGRYATVVDEG